ncbi:MAG: ASKHA domain-containing protein [Lachnospiraceae bacterium]|nr:ASKHA domain-containing protein [Lachnospiraceae bacterium]
MYTLIFKIENEKDVKVLAEAGDNVLELMQKNNISIDAPCSGNGVCGKCRVRIIAGSVDMEKNPHLSEEDYQDQWRLACQSKVVGDATLWVPASAAAFKADIKTADISSPEELERYENAINEIFNAGLDIQVEAKEGEVGIAIDIGTTTCTAAMLDLHTRKVLGKASLGNGQIRYGADVINRIIQQTKEGGVDKLRSAVREETLLPMIESLLKESKKEEKDITRYVIAGNTTMEHLFLGANGESIRLEPFVPEFLQRRGDTAKSCGLPGQEDAEVVFAPNVGSYVGGDITAGTLDSMLWNGEEMTLFIDLGTNGELVFGNSDFMLTCACSAGPAFEGGDISCGMRATKGAIDSVELDPETYEPTYSIIGGNSDGLGGRNDAETSVKPAGLCGSGLISIISELFQKGAINAKGKFVGQSPRIKYDEEIGSGEYIVATAEESASGSELTLTESDLDNFIRAKGAIFSAIQTMLKSLDMDVDCIDKVILAGGIGSGIDMEKAISIGMLPKIPLEKYSYIGNSSLTGACAMLLSNDATQKVFDIANNMTYLELSTYPGYMDELLAACFIPHTDATLFD